MGRKLFAHDDPVGREGKLQLSTFAQNNLIGYAQMCMYVNLLYIINYYPVCSI